VQLFVVVDDAMHMFFSRCRSTEN